ncbi:MAG: hypothetical protein IAE79_17605 [Anaerolinea sp.]|nr:hypothetical protein [Anaerolinea sp.]
MGAMVTAVLHVNGTRQQEISGKLLRIAHASAEAPGAAVMVWLETDMGPVGILNRGDGWHRTFETTGDNDGDTDIPTNGLG